MSENTMEKQEFDEISEQSESLNEKPLEGIYEFDWKNKWLKGDEYAHILQNIDAYCKNFNFLKYPKKQHPESIYTDPQNGMIYFVEGNSVGSEFGFPRVEIKKRYRWKKMNFTTDLPKSRPFVTYIVASAVKCEKFFPKSNNEGPSFRMHAVILNKNGANSYREKISNQKHQPIREISQKNNEKEFILCHIRKIDSEYKAGKKNSENSSEEEKLEKTYKIKKIKLEENCEQKNLNMVNKDDENVNFINYQAKQPQKTDDKWEGNQSLALKFNKMNINVFQLFCIHKVLDRNFTNMVNELCEVPGKKHKYENNHFIIHQELSKKEAENSERDYAKMFSMMN